MAKTELHVTPDVLVTAAMLSVLGMHLYHVWRHGAFLPPLIRLPVTWLVGMYIAVLACLNLLFALVYRTEWFRFAIVRQRRLHSGLLLVAIGVMLLLPAVLRAEGLRNAAYRRDLGGRLQPWAMDLLSARPKTSRRRTRNPSGNA